MLEKDLEIKSTNKQRRKLVDYFNQWWEEKFGEKGHFKYTMRFDEVHLISKKMGFIKWLVDNNKIDFSNIKRIIKDYEVEDKEILEYYDLDFASKEETLIMLLSIQDNPIEFLCSVLK